MPKTAKFPVKKHGNRYRLDIGAKVSPTGKRERIWFEKRKEAEREAKRRRELVEEYGNRALTIAPSLAEQAEQAADMLEPFGVSLLEAVGQYVANREAAAQSVPLSQAFDRFLATREDLSETYRRTIDKLRRRLPMRFMKRQVAELSRREVADALESIASTAPQFNSDLARLRSVLGEAHKEGFSASNPAASIRSRKTEEKRPHVLTAKESRAVLTACKDYRKTEGVAYQVDCRDALPGFAVQLFAGVRPAEITRMTWEHIDFERGHITVPPGAAKTSDWRYIELEPALRAWLEPHKRTESEPLCPSNWDRKRKQVRSASGIAEHADCLRHTFASMWLAAFGDMGGLLERMGHTTQRTTLKHYRRAVLKSDALEFWRIAPEGVEITNVRVA